MVVGTLKPSITFCSLFSLQLTPVCSSLLPAHSSLLQLTPSLLQLSAPLPPSPLPHPRGGGDPNTYLTVHWPLGASWSELEWREWAGAREVSWEWGEWAGREGESIVTREVVGTPKLACRGDGDPNKYSLIVARSLCSSLPPSPLSPKGGVHPNTY